ncbi:hypothetical protein CC80DRAFT_540836 [Byssothecium circinans]|uniref:Uncharacterized protein n=1 Tax=Byssothecium circinans TaxID=147558 RepID=A0A6A5T901_9PLEO|nr:hypothetical protein CC80DRAFT_540836 [Byssothecium circinans]
MSSGHSEAEYGDARSMQAAITTVSGARDYPSPPNEAWRAGINVSIRSLTTCIVGVFTGFDSMWFWSPSPSCSSAGTSVESVVHLPVLWLQLPADDAQPLPTAPGAACTAPHCTALHRPYSHCARSRRILCVVTSCVSPSRDVLPSLAVLEARVLRRRCYYQTWNND